MHRYCCITHWAAWDFRRNSTRYFCVFPLACLGVSSRLRYCRYRSVQSHHEEVPYGTIILQTLFPPKLPGALAGEGIEPTSFGELHFRFIYRSFPSPPLVLLNPKAITDYYHVAAWLPPSAKEGLCYLLSHYSLLFSVSSVS